MNKSCKHSNTSPPLSPMGISAPIFFNKDIQAACVAAGVGRFLNTTNIGNRQYTAGYYPWGTPYNYSRDISATTGNIITSAPYVINTTSQPVEYWWDVNQSLSLSNCSNSGKDLLAVWADTFGIVYKYSPSNAGTTWRVIKPQVSTSKEVYPNPASNSIVLGNNEAYKSYVILDALGKQVQANKSIVPASIDISKLPAGFYTVKATQADGTIFNSKFIKK